MVGSVICVRLREIKVDNLFGMTFGYKRHHLFVVSSESFRIVE